MGEEGGGGGRALVERFSGSATVSMDGTFFKCTTYDVTKKLSRPSSCSVEGACQRYIGALPGNS